MDVQSIHIIFVHLKPLDDDLVVDLLNLCLISGFIESAVHKKFDEALFPLLQFRHLSLTLLPFSYEIGMSSIEFILDDLSEKCDILPLRLQPAQIFAKEML